MPKIFVSSTKSDRNFLASLRGWRNRMVVLTCDPAIRYGIKFGLAGVSAFSVSQALRLDSPTWSVITVFVLMMGRYVGAIAEKSFYRVVGTVAGGVVGTLLTGSLQQEPLLYLPLVGLVVGFSTAMFGQTRAPYAFLLFGLTTVVVASNGMSNPDFSWDVALTRIEEVLVGVVVTLLVSSLLWPRFARVEFFEQVRLEISRMQEEFDVQARAFLSGVRSPVQRASSLGRLLALRNLLHFGARESARFHKRLPTYHAVVRALSRTSAALDTLSDDSVLDSFYKPYLLAEMEGLRVATGSLFEAFASGDSSREQAALDQVSAATRALDAGLRRAAEIGHSVQLVETEAALDLGAWLQSHEEIQKALLEVGHLLGTLPEGEVSHGRDTHPPATPPIDSTWFTNGIRSGIAVMAGLVIENWLHPPGGGMVTLAAWVFTALSRLYPGGEGDRRAFNYTVYTAAGGLLYVVVLLLLTPVLSSYAALNTLLFAAMFLFGWLSFSIPGMSFGMQVAMLSIVGTLGLNPQEPVSFQAITGVYFGIVLGMLISALVQRFLWPILPQCQLQKLLLEWIALCRKQTSTPSIPAWMNVRLALLPSESSAWIQVMNKPDCPRCEQHRLKTAVEILARLSNHLSQRTLLQERDLSPEKSSLVDREIACLFATIDPALAALTTQIQTFRNPPPTIRKSLVVALEQWTQTASEIRRYLAKTPQERTSKLRVQASLDHALRSGRETLLLLDTLSEADLKTTFSDSIL